MRRTPNQSAELVADFAVRYSATRTHLAEMRRAVDAVIDDLSALRADTVGLFDIDEFNHELEAIQNAAWARWRALAAGDTRNCRAVDEVCDTVSEAFDVIARVGTFHNMLFEVLGRPEPAWRDVAAGFDATQAWLDAHGRWGPLADTIELAARRHPAAGAD